MTRAELLTELRSQNLGGPSRERAIEIAEELELKWAAASEFVRDVIEACSLPQPDLYGTVDLNALLLQVFGRIEVGKLAEADVSSLQVEVGRLTERLAVSERQRAILQEAASPPAPSGWQQQLAKCHHQHWTADRHRPGIRRCYLCGAADPAQGSCLICGHDRPFAVYHESGLVGVCAECRDRARGVDASPRAHPDHRLPGRVSAYIRDFAARVSLLETQLTSPPAPSGWQPEVASAIRHAISRLLSNNEQPAARRLTEALGLIHQSTEVERLRYALATCRLMAGAHVGTCADKIISYVDEVLAPPVSEASPAKEQRDGQ